MTSSNERHREREVPEVQGTYQKYKYGAPYTSQVQTLYHKLEVMDDSVVPNFQRRIKRGEVINNHCTYVVETTTCGGGSYTAANPPGNTVYTSSGGSQTSYHASFYTGYGIRSLPNPNTEDLHQAAKMKAIANIDSTPYAMSEDAFEIRETLRFLRNPLRTLAGLSRSFKRAVKSRTRLSVKNAGDVVKDAADVWLTYRFAATPLVKSAMDIHHSLTVQERTRPPRAIARGVAQSSNTTLSEPRCYYNATVYDDFRRNEMDNTVVRSGIMYEVTNPLYDFQFRYGLRAKDIPETLWAVLPYSFVVDRVVDISSSIRALTNLLDPNVKILTGWVTTKQELENQLEHLAQYNPPWTVSIDGDLVVDHKFTYDRAVWTPTAFDTVPVVDFNGLIEDAKSITDLCSLILQRLRF